jgi:hypothetical protein
MMEMSCLEKPLNINNNRSCIISRRRELLLLVLVLTGDSHSFIHWNKHIVESLHVLYIFMCFFFMRTNYVWVNYHRHLSFLLSNQNRLHLIIKELIPMSIGKLVRKKKDTRPAIINDVMICFLIFLTFFKLEFFLFVLLRCIRVKQKNE